MRALPALFVIALLSLSACSKPKSEAQSGIIGDAPASNPVILTDVQVKTIQKTLPAPYNTADLVNGEKQFNKCRSCHTLGEGEINMTGPNLYTVFGRKSGTMKGYTYSEAMTAHNTVWDYDSLFVYLQSPGDVVKGTKMGFLGLKKDQDRRDVIAYIRVQTTKPVSQ